jgi:hypothetical protein
MRIVRIDNLMAERLVDKYRLMGTIKNKEWVFQRYAESSKMWKVTRPYPAKNYWEYRY